MSVDPAAATRLAGRYVLQELIAAGGMGEVHLAVDERLGRRVAVKTMSRAVSEFSDSVERFRREAVTVAGLNHPNIAQVYDYGVEGGSHYIVMEYAEGSDLSRLLRERGRIGADEAIAITTQVCAALAVAHRAGVVHRDIKPGNVIVGPDGTVKVTDFGIARSVGHTALTDAGTVLGTAQYLPPEQARGASATPASDLYSLGILLYQMVAGSAPFTGDSPVAIAMRHLDEQVPPPSRAVPGLPPVIDRVVGRATAKSPTDRYPDADAMARALRSADHTEVYRATGATAGAAAAATSVFPSTRALPPMPDRHADHFGAAADAPLSRAGVREEQRRRRPGPLVLAAGGVLVAVAFVWLVVAALTASSGPEAAPTPSVSRVVAPTTRPEPQPSTEPPTETAQAPTTEPEQTPTPEAQSVAVPDGLVGGDPGFARNALESLDFRVKVVEIRSETPKGEVLATFPSAGNEVPRGATVVLVESKGGLRDHGGQQFTVPSGLLGAAVDDARQLVEGSGMRAVVVQTPWEGDAGTVVATYPGEGELTRGDQVVLVVSTGPESE